MSNKKELNLCTTVTRLEVMDEKEAGKLPPKVLCRVKGPVAFTGESRNGRSYGDIADEFWPKALKGDYITEMMENDSAIGETDHPVGRDDTLYERTSHVIRKLDYKVTPNGGEVDWVADILDTPHGKIMEALIKAGVGVGVSARARGAVDSHGRVDPDSYELLTFDFVHRPGFEKARARLCESFQETDVKAMEQLDESLTAQVPSMSAEAVDTAKVILESLGEKALPKLRQALNERMGEKAPQTEVQELRESLSQAQSQLKDAQGELSKQQLETQRLQESYAAERANLKGKIRELVKGSDNLGKVVQEQATQLDEVKREKVELEKQLSVSESYVGSLRDEVKTLNLELTDLRQRAEQPPQVVTKFVDREVSKLQRDRTYENQLREAYKRREIVWKSVLSEALDALGLSPEQIKLVLNSTTPRKQLLESLAEPIETSTPAGVVKISLNESVRKEVAAPSDPTTEQLLKNTSKK